MRGRGADSQAGRGANAAHDMTVDQSDSEGGVTAAPGSYRPALPFHMVWLATDACNARCAHCSSNSACRSADELSTTEACRLMEELACSGIVDIAISGGEPLLRQDLMPVIEHARRRGMSVGVGSNGAYLTEDKARCLQDYGISRFQVSLDGPREAHDTLRRWNGLFDRVLRTIRIAQRVGLRTHVCCTVNRLNHDTLEPFAAQVASLGVTRLNLSRFVPTGRGTHALDLTLDQWRTVIARCQRLKERYAHTMEIVSHLAQQILVDPEVRRMPGFIGCQAGVGQGAVTANGTVQPCVLLPIPVGNIRQSSFRQIWTTSPIIMALQNRDTITGACSRCSVRARCGGCRAVAYAKTGDYLASDPRCWLPSREDAVRNPLDVGELATAYQSSAPVSSGCV